MSPHGKALFSGPCHSANLPQPLFPLPFPAFPGPTHTQWLTLSGTHSQSHEGVNGVHASSQNAPWRAGCSKQAGAVDSFQLLVGWT